MEFIYFTLVAFALYFLADRILLWIEGYLDRRLEQRSVVFLFLLLAMAMAAFWIIRSLAG